MTHRHPLDGNAIAADRYYGDGPDARICTMCGEFFCRDYPGVGCPECDGLGDHDRHNPRICVACSANVEEM